MSHKHRFEIHNDFTSAHAAHSNAAAPSSPPPAVPARRERSVPLVDDSDTDIEEPPPGYVQILNSVRGFCTPLLPLMWSYAAKFITLTKGGYIMIGGGVVAGFVAAAALASSVLVRKKTPAQPSDTPNAATPRETKTPKAEPAKKQIRVALTDTNATPTPRSKKKTKVVIGSTAAAVAVVAAASLAVFQFSKTKEPSQTDGTIEPTVVETTPHETTASAFADVTTPPPLAVPVTTTAQTVSPWTPVVTPQVNVPEPPKTVASLPPILPETQTPVPNLFAADTLPPIASLAPKETTSLKATAPEVVSTPVAQEPLVPSRSGFELANTKPEETPRPLVATTPEKTSPAFSEPVAAAAAVGLGTVAAAAAVAASSPYASLAAEPRVVPVVSEPAPPPLASLPRSPEPAPTVNEMAASNAPLATPFTPPPTATQSQTESVAAANIVAPPEPFVSLASTRAVVPSMLHAEEESPAVPDESVVAAAPATATMASVVERVQDVQRDLASSQVAPPVYAVANPDVTPIVVEDAPFLPESEDLTNLLPRHSAAAPTLIASSVPMSVPVSPSVSIPPLVMADVQPKYQTASPPADQSLSAFAPLQGAPNVSSVPHPGSLYRAQTGDNFWTIAQTAYGSPKWYRDLALYNRARVANPAQIEGAVIDIPTLDALQRFASQGTTANTASTPVPSLAASTVSNTPAARPLVTATFAPRSPAQPPAGSTIYIVQSGETLASIAETKLGSRSLAAEIARLNPQKVGADGNVVAGTELFIPRSQARQSTAAYTRRDF